MCVEDKNEVVQIDTKANTLLARWSVAPGDAPTGLDIDLKGHRLFVGCGNQKMIVLEFDDGQGPWGRRASARGSTGVQLQSRRWVVALSRQAARTGA